MSDNTVTSLKIDVEHYPGTVKTKKATITLVNHKTGESQVLECENNTHAMRVIAMNVMMRDIAQIEEMKADENWLKNNGISGNA